MSPTSRRNWEEVTRPLGRARRRGWTRRLDANVVALAILSVIGCALLVFVFMSGGGDQIPRGPYFAFVAPRSSQSPQISVIQPTPTQAIQATATAHMRPTNPRQSRVRPRLHRPPRSQPQHGRRSQPLLLLHDPPQLQHHSRRRHQRRNQPRRRSHSPPQRRHKRQRPSSPSVRIPSSRLRVVDRRSHSRSPSPIPAEERSSGASTPTRYRLGCRQFRPVVRWMAVSRSR